MNMQHNHKNRFNWQMRFLLITGTFLLFFPELLNLFKSVKTSTALSDRDFISPFICYFAALINILLYHHQRIMALESKLQAIKSKQTDS